MPEIKARAIARAQKHYEKIKPTEKYKAWVRERSKRLLLIHQIQRMANRQLAGGGRRLTREQGAEYHCCSEHRIRLPKDVSLHSLFLREIRKLHR